MKTDKTFKGAAVYYNPGNKELNESFDRAQGHGFMLWSDDGFPDALEAFKEPGVYMVDEGVFRVTEGQEEAFEGENHIIKHIEFMRGAETGVAYEWIEDYITEIEDQQYNDMPTYEEYYGIDNHDDCGGCIHCDPGHFGITLDY